jgi:hypothetical protein
MLWTLAHNPTPCPDSGKARRRTCVRMFASVRRAVASYRRLRVANMVRWDHDGGSKRARFKRRAATCLLPQTMAGLTTFL